MNYWGSHDDSFIVGVFLFSCKRGSLYSSFVHRFIYQYTCVTQIIPVIFVNRTPSPVPSGMFQKKKVSANF